MLLSKLLENSKTGYYSSCNISPEPALVRSTADQGSLLNV